MLQDPKSVLGEVPPEPIEDGRGPYDALDGLGNELYSRWFNWSQLRYQQELEWLSALRAFNQIDEPDPAPASILHSHIYTGDTRTKTITAFSQLVQTVFQDGDAHWQCDPSPSPTLPPDRMAAIDAQVMMAGMMGQVLGDGTVIPTPAEELLELRKTLIGEVAQESSEGMTKEMEDQLNQLGYENAVKFAVFEGCLLGTGCVKGITPGARINQNWAPQHDIVSGAMRWDMQSTVEPYPQLSAHSVFDLYPDPYATTDADSSGTYLRHVLTSKQLFELADDPSFDGDAIREVISFGTGAGKGTHQPLHHEIERLRIANVLDTTGAYSDRYDVLEYWGVVRRDLLRSTGVEMTDEQPYLDAGIGAVIEPDVTQLPPLVWANVWTLRNKTIKAQLWPLKRQVVPFHCFRYFKSPHSYWGTGIPWAMRYSQRCINGVTRAMLDNAAFASGPQVEYNPDMIQAGQDISLRPWGEWLREMGDPAYPAVRFYQPDLNADKLERLLDIFKKSAQEESSQPAYTYGQASPGLNQTASGASMLMGQQQVSKVSTVKNLEDDLIEPVIRSLFDWNMEWNPDPEIKGDHEVKITASSRLLAKEMQSQRLIQFAQTASATPVGQIMGVNGWLAYGRNMARSLDINPDEILPDENELERNIQANAAAGMGQPQGAPGGQMAGGNQGGANSQQQQQPGEQQDVPSAGIQSGAQ